VFGLAEVVEEEFDPDEPDELGELDEPDEFVEDELLLLSPLLEELSPLDLLSELPLLSDGDAVLFTSVFSPLFSDLASGSLSFSE
jgi:hypothetical protein